ncbi:hypothetical protein PFISCL1PPCAC_17438, partial [Pristionchus fissidentatus]
QAIELCAFIGIGALNEEQRNERQRMVFGGKDYCTEKALFISDSDKRKYFELSLQLFYGCGLDIGNFPSERIKVISKPSKKKQSENQKDSKFLCIAGGTKVALFNRIRSQAISTRYLYVDNGHFTASASQWGAFDIHLCLEHSGTVDIKDDSTKFETKEGFVHYGAAIKLIDTVSGIALPRMRIRKVDKSLVMLDSREPVSQLHKIAFQLDDNENVYLSHSQDKIFQHQAKPVTGNPMRHHIPESATWTIISAETKEYRFFEANGPVRNTISTIPKINTVDVTAGLDGRHRLVLRGSEFTNDFSVWLHTVQVNAVFRDSNFVSAWLPTVSEMINQCDDLSSTTISGKELPISLVRNDGVIFRTDFTYAYRTTA